MINKIRNCEEYNESLGCSKLLYDLIKKSYKGYIAIQKVKSGCSFLKPNEWFEGITEAFGEGLRLNMKSKDMWYSTNVISAIHDDTFTTLSGSIYKYKLLKDEDN